MEAARIDVKELTSPDEHARPQAHYGRRALMAVAAASTLAVSAFGTVLLLRSPAATGVDLVHESVARKVPCPAVAALLANGDLEHLYEYKSAAASPTGRPQLWLKIAQVKEAVSKLGFEEDVSTGIGNGMKFSVLSEVAREGHAFPTWTDVDGDVHLDLLNHEAMGMGHKVDTAIRDNAEKQPSELAFAALMRSPMVETVNGEQRVTEAGVARWYEMMRKNDPARFAVCEKAADASIAAARKKVAGFHGCSDPRLHAFVPLLQAFGRDSEEDGSKYLTAADMRRLYLLNEYPEGWVPTPVPTARLQAAQARATALGVARRRLQDYESDPLSWLWQGFMDMPSPAEPEQQPAVPTVCGAAVANADCQGQLWGPTGDMGMHCYAYKDACALDMVAGVWDAGSKFDMDKDPSRCHAADKVFYLWNEPDQWQRLLPGATYDYKWAARQWVTYARRWSRQITDMRRDGFRFTSPFLTPEGTTKAIADFYEACGTGCEDKASPAYIDTIAVNSFCGPWSARDGREQPTEQDCRANVGGVLAELQKVPQINGERGSLPVRITNWGRVNGHGRLSPDDQLAAMDAADAWFGEGSPVEAVYWFAQTFGGHSLDATDSYSVTEIGNKLSQRTSSGRTLGQVWEEKCKAL